MSFLRDEDGRLVTSSTWDGTPLGSIVAGFLTNADGALVIAWR